MIVTVKLFASLRTGRFEVERRQLPEGATVGEAIAALGIPAGQAAVVFVDSRHASPDRALAEGEVLAIFPPVGGG